MCVNAQVRRDISPSYLLPLSPCAFLHEGPGSLLGEPDRPVPVYSIRIQVLRKREKAGETRCSQARRTKAKIGPLKNSRKALPYASATRSSPAGPVHTPKSQANRSPGWFFAPLAAAVVISALVFLAACSASGPEDTPGASPSGPSGTTGQSEGSEAQAQDVSFADVEHAAVSGNFVICGDCHAALDRSAHAGSTLVEGFTHSLHLQAGAQCDSCHMVPTHTNERINRPTMARCFECHSQAEGDAPPGECSLCHPPGFPLVPSSHDSPEWLPARDLIDSTQGQHSKQGPRPDECAVCHAPAFCSGCHKVDMPHPDTWTQTHPETAAEVGSRACDLCHPNQNACMVCHHPGYTPEGPPWWRIHPQSVRTSGVERCLTCHSTKTCAHCHTTGEYQEFD